MSGGTYTPRPGAAPLVRRVLAQAALEARLLLRHGEQLILAVVVPIGLLTLLATVPVVDTGAGPAVDFLVPGILALVVVSTAFTGQAIATGYERRYGVLRRLAVSPLGRPGLLAGKSLAVLVVEALQVALVLLVGALLGWRPAGAGVTSVLAAITLVVLGTVTFTALGLLLAGLLRAEATLAAANLLYLLMLVLGGVVVPLDRFPASLQPVLEALPVTALATGLRSVLSGDALADGAGLPGRSLVVLGAWALLAVALAARTFRWD